MEQNMGFADKVIRIIVGVIVVVIGFYYNSWWGLLGLIPLVTAALGYCGLYTVFGINTCATHQKATHRK